MFSFSLSAVKSYLTSAAINKDILMVSLGLMFGGILLVSFLIFSVIYCNIRKIRRLHRRILIIEDILNEECKLK